LVSQEGLQSMEIISICAFYSLQSSSIYDDNRLENSRNLLPSKHDIISCLAVGGRWVTSKANLQVGITIHRSGIHVVSDSTEKK
jgi:hypothetical protein